LVNKKEKDDAKEANIVLDDDETDNEDLSEE
jgi:cbb3-type cytochrome oxidase subunit 3